MQPEGRRRREFRREIREGSDRVPEVSGEPVAQPLERSPEVATTAAQRREPPKASRQKWAFKAVTVSQLRLVVNQRTPACPASAAQNSTPRRR